MTDTHWWPEDYFSSREKFVQLGHALGATLHSHPVSVCGPRGESLSVDVAALTSYADEHRIILISGVHGVEGYLGASVQIATMENLLANGLPDKTGLVMIHAANPWGYAHSRRVDEHNVDMNRNFIRFAEKPVRSARKYAELDAVINPRVAPSFSGELHYWLNALRLIAQNGGIAKLFKPIAEGQYNFKRGVFFGGESVGESCQLLQHLVLEHAANSTRVSVLDVHTGLGPSGTASIIGNCNIVPANEQLHWLRTQFGLPAYADASEENLYNATGTFSRWCSNALRDRRFLFLCIELGTVNPIKLFSALRRENQAHHWAHESSAVYAKTKRDLRAVFAPPSLRWKKKSLQQCRHVLTTVYNFSDSG